MNGSPSLFLPVLIESINRTLSSVPSGTWTVAGIRALGGAGAGAGAATILCGAAFGASTAAGFSGCGVVAAASSAEPLAQPLKVRVNAMMNNMYENLFIVSPHY